MDEPAGWKVSAKLNTDGAEAVRQLPHEVKFGTKEEAERYKSHPQSKGWVACVVPMYVTRSTVIRRNKKLQTEPFGDFRRDWQIHQ